MMLHVASHRNAENMKLENGCLFTLKAEFTESDCHAGIKQETDIENLLSSDPSQTKSLLFHQLNAIKEEPGEANELSLIKKEESDDLLPVCKMTFKCEDSVIQPTGLIPPVEVDDECDIARRRHTKCLHQPMNINVTSAKEKLGASNVGGRHSCKKRKGKHGQYCGMTRDAKVLRKKQIPKRETFLCEDCGKTFLRSDLLTDHMKVHRRKRPYICDQCDKTFTKPAYLKIHLRRHAGERTIHCEQCDRCFFDKHDLRVHLRDHTGERPYQCPECEKSFKRMYILNKHKRTHSKEKPYRCEICGKAYRYIYSYRSHMKEHTD